MPTKNQRLLTTLEPNEGCPDIEDLGLAILTQKRLKPKRRWLKHDQVWK